jgi:hypothetical protein
MMLLGPGGLPQIFSWEEECTTNHHLFGAEVEHGPL